jgi:hypothetical protein
MTVTEEGMQIDGSRRQLTNALSPSSETRQPDAKLTSERAAQRQKQHFGITVIDEGIIIERSDEQD